MKTFSDLLLFTGITVHPEKLLRPRLNHGKGIIDLVGNPGGHHPELGVLRLTEELRIAVPGHSLELVPIFFVNLPDTPLRRAHVEEEKAKGDDRGEYKKN